MCHAKQDWGMRSVRILVLTLVVVLCGAGTWWWTNSRQAGNLGVAAHALTAEILALGPRPPGSAGLDAVRGLVRDRLMSSGWSVQFQEFQRETPVGTVKFANLRARFASAGQDPWQKVPEGLLCAHIDSKMIPGQHFLGADDAASACAAIVEMAGFLARQRPEQAAKLELVLFDGEESFGESITPQDGLYGSRHYAGLWRNQPAKPRFGILLDMIGHEDLSIRIPSDSPPDLAKRMFAAAKEEGVGSHFGTAPGSIIDDHVPLNFAGIPTLDVIGDFTRFRWWHTPADQLKVISPVSLDISIRVTLRMLDGLL